jgi:hypothetical protein
MPETREGVPSEATHSVSLRNEAARLRSPEASLAHPSVHGFLDVLTQVDDLRASMDRWAGQEEHTWLPALSLRNRYDFADSLLTTETTLLRTGFNNKQVDLGDLQFPRYHFDLALGYLRRLSRSRPIGQPLPEIEVEEQSAEGLWQAPDQSHAAKAVKRADKPPDAVLPLPTWARDLPDPHDWQDSQQKARVLQEAQRLSITPEDVETDLPLRGLLVHIAWTKDVLTAQEQGTSLAPAAGLTPTAQTRLERMSHITRGALMVLEDGLAGNRLEADTLAGELNKAFIPYGLNVQHRKPGAA